MPLERPARPAGCRDADGYLVMKFEGVMFKVHRIIWKMVTGKEPVTIIDHRNTVRTDNRWANLREATRSGSRHHSSSR